MSEQPTIHTKPFEPLTKLLLLFLLLLCLLPRGLQAQGFPAEGGGFPTNLNSWSFADTNTWQSDLSCAPVSFTNLESSLMGNVFGSYSLRLDSTNPAWLHYNFRETNGLTNLTITAGSVVLWFAPNWASATTNQNGSGPGDWGRLLEVGAYTTNASYGWWSLHLDPGGTNLYFSAQTNSGDGATVTYLSAPIDWATNVWHHLALTYSATNTALYLDGALVATNAGVTVFPGPEVLTNGFWIGSDSNGLAQAHGFFDDLYTYDFPLDAGAVASLYSFFLGNYSINFFNVTAPVTFAPSTPAFTPSFRAVTGAGWLQWLGSAASCVTNNDVWLTNVTSVLTGAGANLSATVAFEIAGGNGGAAYDVFATAALSPEEPAYGWAWLGQGFRCHGYQVPGLPPRATYLILGTAQDLDGDGLTDAWESLVGHTDPNSADTDSDGVEDGIEFLQGRNPLVADALADTGGVVQLEVFTPLP